MKIEMLPGTAPRLYSLIAPLVMSPAVLRQNNNYPFKTSKRHTWLVATEKENVCGFMPVEVRDHLATLNNYHVTGDDVKVLSALIGRATATFCDHSLVAVVHCRHAELFRKAGFTEVRTWKLYLRMEYANLDQEHPERI